MNVKVSITRNCRLFNVLFLFCLVLEIKFGILYKGIQGECMVALIGFPQREKEY